MQDIILRVVTLGRFGVYHGREPISTDSRKHQKVWLLYQYLLTAHPRRVPVAELFEVLGLKDNAVYPDKALQNLVYRLRQALSTSGAEGAALVKFARGSYYLGEDMPLQVDAFEMRAQIARAGELVTGGDMDALIGCAEEMRDLYGGPYLEEAAEYAWAAGAAAKLRDEYVTVLGLIARAMLAAGRAEDALAILEGAAQVAEQEASLCAYRVEALLALKETRRAGLLYERIKDQLLPEMIAFVPLLRELHSRTALDGGSDQMDMGMLMSMLDAPASSGAFVCDRDVFSKLFQLEERRIARTGQIVFLVLITLGVKQGMRLSNDQLARAADLLGDTLAVTLRRGDVITRLNQAQFALLLPTITFEDGEMVIRRLVSRFEMRNQVPGIEVTNKLEPIQRLP